MAKTTGAQRHSARLKAIPAKTRREVGKAIFVGAGVLMTEARRSIVAGAIQGKGHVPSLPGEPPNRDTAQLDSSIIAKKTGQLTAEVAAEAPYGVALEFGTTKMAERPFMRPATKKSRPIIERLAGKAVSLALRKS